MGDKTTSLVGGPHASDANPALLRAQIAETRDEMSNTIEQLHGRLNPALLKDQAMDQFHEATSTVKAELKAHFADAKEVVKAELKEAKEIARSELREAKAAFKAEMREELDAAKARASDELENVKTRLNDELVHAQAAMRDATIGKVETMVQNTKNKVRGTSKSVVDVLRDNPVPTALVGVGLAWLLVGGSRTRRAAAHEYAGYEVETDDAPGLASRAARGIQHAAGAGGHQISELAHRAGDAAGQLAHGAATQGRRVATRGGDLYDANPLAVGAVAVAVGAAIGLALPRTRMEDQLLGATSDDLVEKAQELVHTAIGQAGEAAEHLVDDMNTH